MRRTDKIDVSVWRADQLGAVELLRGRFADYAYDTHTHDKACLAFLEAGTIRIRMRTTEFTAHAGDLYAIDAEEPHAGWPVDASGWRLRTLYVDMRELRARLDPDGTHSADPRPLSGPLIRDPDLARLFRMFHRGSELSRPSLPVEEKYLDFAARLFERHTRDPSTDSHGAGREDRAVRLARAFLDDRLDQRVGLQDIALVAGLPPFRLFRAFRRATGMSPHAYQRQARIRFATGLIRHGHSLGEIAAAAGFSDQAHMTRGFRRSLGVTPGAYRRAFADTRSTR